MMNGENAWIYYCCEQNSKDSLVGCSTIRIMNFEVVNENGFTENREYGELAMRVGINCFVAKLHPAGKAANCRNGFGAVVI